MVYSFIQYSLGEILAQQQALKQALQALQAAAAAQAQEPRMKNHLVRASTSTVNPTFAPTVYSGAQLAALYQVPPLLPTSGKRTITLAIVVAFHSATLFTDLSTFLSEPSNQTLGQSITAVGSVSVRTTAGGTITQVNLNTQTQPRMNNNIQGWNTEESMDLQACVSMNPAANIIVVEAVSDSTTDLIAAVTYAKTRADIISISWGGDDVTANNAYSSVFNSSTAIFCCSTGDANSVSWPAVHPNCVAVGGTSRIWAPVASTSPLGIVDYTWSGAGCGFSLTQTKPLYQSNVNTTSKRAIPDLSMVASPNTAFNTFNGGGGGGWNMIGGTSLACPLFAGILSILLQNALNHNRPLPPSSTDLLTRLYAHNNSTIFSPVDNGNDKGTSSTSSSLVVYNTSTGYDIPTGLGTPNVSVMLTTSGFI